MRCGKYAKLHNIEMFSTPPKNSKEPVAGGSGGSDGHIGSDAKVASRREMEGVGKADAENRPEDQARDKVTSRADSRTPQVPIEKMTVQQLRDELQKKNLSTVGTKKILRKRLQEVMERDVAESEADTTDDSDDEEVNPQVIVSRTRNQKPSDLLQPERRRSRRYSPTRSDSRIRAREVDNEAGCSQDEARSEVQVQANRQQDVLGRRDVAQINHMAGTFTIKDVEGSIPTFTGDDKVTIHSWIEEFEDTSVLLRWNDLQKVIYGKKMLRGSAKQFMALQRGLVSWAALKDCLIEEFKVEVNSAIIHNQLQKRKRQVNETPRQYIYAMRTIANQGRVEDEALIQYIIDGVPDDETNKQILYNSRTIDEMKKNLELYDRMREKTGRKKTVGKGDAKIESNKEKKDAKEKKDGKQTVAKKAHCFACGSVDHAVKECPNKDKGPKCFKCDQFGHISSNCENEAKSKRVEVVNRVTVGDEIIAVQVNKMSVLAVLDTGSSKTILRNDEYVKMGSPVLKPTACMFKGFGNAQSKAIVVFDAELTIQGEIYHNEVHVVPVEAMDVKMLLGRNLHKQMDIRIVGGETMIKKVAARADNGASAHKSEDEKCSQSNQPRNRSNRRNEVDEVQDGLLAIRYVEPSELNIQEARAEEIQKLIDDYKPNRQVQTSVEMKIVLKDQEPVCAKPRRMSVEEKQILQR